ncbi:uncharacterized protein MELLADRAFT_111419 [Melampsora larici-populina 98AG31]|uniref:Autophagy-related protein 11 n=1 Tax=Melampsora larici-populina (strain 98AG31 / pathotype 3-4-7) TaxID=747676 RepID=F4S352_MELLP|nr:uncharacterized protein MELLADRAFT_111419 [Melampsora larici-populina 98AG31]EGG00969.1 hypothetical protein MELLADRAFT_111419 [Melampsora larici-populina 98AG31]
MRVIRAHDGVTFEFTKQHLQNVDRLSALLDILGPAMDLDADDLILMNSLGSQLTDTLLRPILDTHRSPTSSPINPMPSSSTALIPHPRTLQDPTHLLYAFDRNYLSADPNKVLEELLFHVEEALEPPIRQFNSNLDTEIGNYTTLAKAHHTSGSAHFRTTLLLLSHIRAQKSAVEAALNNLDKCRESPKGAWEAFETFAQPLVEGYGKLLEAYAPALALSRLVKIHPQLLSNSTLSRTTSSGSAVGSSGTPVTAKLKCMGDYVMEDRITQIRDRCLKVYDDLCKRFERIRDSSREVDEGAMAIRNGLCEPDCDLTELDVLERDAEEGFQRIEEVVHQILQVTEAEAEVLAESFTELVILDDDTRERVAFLAERKNFWLHHLVHSLNRISVLQGIMSCIGSDVQALDNELSTRTDAFKHLARLKDFVTSYASTVVEVVRRREFSRHLVDYASALSNALSKLTADERKRRVTYRADYGGKMPFTVEGLDDINVPTIEFEFRNVNSAAINGARPKDSSRSVQNVGDLPPLTRADVDGFLYGHVDLISSLRSIEESPEKEQDNDLQLARAPARDVRLLVEKQFSRLESMENAFAQAVERIVVTESQLSTSSCPVDNELTKRLESEVTELKAINEDLRQQAEQEKVSSENSTRKFQSDLKLHSQKIEDLKLQLLQSKEEHREECERLAHDTLTSTQERESLLADVQRLRPAVERLEEELKTRSKSLQDAERQLISARATADDATKELHDLEARHRDQLSDHSHVLNQLQGSQDRVAELESQLSQALDSNRDLTERVDSSVRSMDDRLSEAERIRLEMQNEIDQLKSDLMEQQKSNHDANDTIQQQKLRIEEMDRESQLRAEDHAKVQRQLTEDTREATMRLETHCRAAVSILQSYHLVNSKIVDRIESMPRPGSTHKAVLATSTALGESAVPAQDSSNSVVVAKPATDDSSIPDPSSPEFGTFIDKLAQRDPEAIVELVQNKLDYLSLTVRKWMKESKGYRERAKSSQELANVRITFRDFAKGDLALFLPTRNPTAQVWAAFNVSFPHYFLQANDAVAPIIKSREWLVARIISLTEKMVDPKDPDTNPYALSAGTRYFLLEVEPWSVEKNPRKITQSSLGLGQPSSVTKHSPSRSATLPSQMALQISTSGGKRHSTGGPTFNRESRQSPPSTTPALVNTSPEEKTSISAPSHSNPHRVEIPLDLTQSEFTVIDTPPSPPANEIPGDSPFVSSVRTTASSPPSRRTGPSALSLSLAKSYSKSPLSHASVPLQTSLIPVSEAIPEDQTLDDLQTPSAFKPSESARPAFLTNLSVASSQSRRTNLSSTMPVPLKPRLRPVPKAHTASRSNSRASSIASSSHISPAIKKLLQPASPSSKGFTTVSTTLVSSEKNVGSSPKDNDIRPSVVLSSDKPSPLAIGPTNVVGAKDLANRRVSVSGSNQGGIPFNVNRNSSSSLSNSSMGGSGQFIQQGGQIAGSPTTSIGVANNGGNTGGLSGSFFGTWRKRKESEVMPGSFGASELLKRFSSQNPPSSPKS